MSRNFGITWNYLELGVPRETTLRDNAITGLTQ